MSTDPASDSVEPTDPQTWNRYTYARNNPLVRVDPDGETDIYIGGAADSRTKIVKSYAKGQEGTPGRTVKYFTHKQVKEATAFANASLKNGEPLNIIGHSWGADAAVKVAAGVNGTVNTLVGVDPVGKPFGGAGERPANVTNVVTVDAQASSPDLSDCVEAAGVCIGGRPDAFTDSADTTISVDANHDEFEQQYTAQGAGGESAKDIVDKTYQRPKE